MGTSDQPSRSKLLLWLVGFVVVFGGASWGLSEEIGRHGAPLIHSQPSTFIPAPTPTPLVCAPTQLGLTGVFHECGTAAQDKLSSCSVSVNALDARLQFAGTTQVFVLYIEIKSFYTGPGMYYLPPWQFGLGTNDVPKVAVLQPATGTFWESVAGGVTVTGADGRSGNLSAILQASSASLQASTGNTVVPGPTLSVDGPWSCP
ncbi:MAG: hypothetical protein WAN83_12630 [Candidatus Dormiibacterota bacterium]